jgi:alpha-ketoglutarate-dependent taurine dioxygenase
MSADGYLFHTTQLDIAPVGGRIGAEVRGFDLAADITEDQSAAILDALYKHKVLFFRDQHHLDDAAQEAFATRLGRPVPHPTVPVREGSSYLLELDSLHGGRASSWHTDVTFVDAYPAASILRAVTSPESGGDTTWANTTAAYERLPAPLKTLVDGLWALHTNAYDYAATRADVDEEKVRRHREVFASTVYETEHPVVRVHPVTGRTALFVNPVYTQRFEDMTAEESRPLLQHLFDHATSAEFTCRLRWTSGTLAIWDNRCLLHLAVNDYDGSRRLLHRTTVAGERPLGPGVRGIDSPTPQPE